MKKIREYYCDGGEYKNMICYVDMNAPQIYFKRLKKQEGKPTSNELEFFAIYALMLHIRHMSDSSKILIHSDSTYITKYLDHPNGNSRNITECLIDVLKNKCMDLITELREKNISVKVEWVKRDFNVAGRILEKIHKEVKDTKKAILVNV